MKGASIEIRVLGPIELVVGGESVRIGSSIRRTILAVLASRPNTEVPIDGLITALWGDEAGRTAVQRLPFHIAKLASLFDDSADVDQTENGYVLRIDSDRIDAHRFEALTARAAQTDDPGEAGQMLAEALGLWRGDPYEGVDRAAIGTAEIARFERLRLTATEELYNAPMNPASAASMVSSLHGLVERHPYREGLRALLMKALYLDGQQAEALRVFAETRKVFAETLGIAPSPMLQALEDRILRRDPTLTSSGSEDADQGSPRAEPTDPPPSHLQAMVVVDIVDSTATRMRIGDGAMEQLRRRTDMIVAQAARRHGGTITAWLGDGCETVFGSATSAIHAAQDMVTWVHRDNGRLGRVSDVHVRAAVDVGSIEGLAQATHGLSDRALPGTVTISERALAAAGSWSERRDAADGFSTIATDSFADLFPVPPPYDETAPELLGRTVETASLLERVPQVLEGRGCVAALGGPPGIGKSSLVGAVAGRLATQGFVVLASGCSDVPGRPYGPITALLERWIDHVPEYDLHLGEGAEALALISERVAAPTQGQSVMLGDADADRARLERAIVAWVEELGTSAPTALVIEDIQWAGAATRKSIEAIAQAARSTRVMLITTSRNTDGSDFTPGQGDVALALAPLASEAAEALVARTDPTLSPAAVSELATRAQGNPLFAVELARHGRAEDGSEIPASLHQTIADRITLLSQQTFDVLTASAVLGDRVEVRVLREMLDAGDALYDALDDGVRTAMLTGPDERLTYRFAHQMVRTVLYEGIGAARRARLHERAGLALESLGREASVPELADHFASAAPLGYADKAARYCEAAAKQAVETFAMAEAAEWYERGIGLAEQDEHLRASLQVGWASAARQVGVQGWSEPLTEVCAVADRLGDGRLLAEAALAGYRGTFTQALRVDEEKVARLRRALDLIPDEEVDLLSRVHAELGLELEWAPDAGLARRHSDRALELAEESGDDLFVTMALTHRLWTLYHPAALREEATERLLDLTAAERRPMLTLEAHGAASFTAIRRGDAHTAEEHLSNVIRLANDIGVPLVHWFVLLRMWPWVLASGRYTEAEQMAEEMYRLGRLTDHPDAEQAYQTHLFWLGFDRRDREQTRQVMAAMVPFARKVNPIAWPSWAHVCAGAGMFDEALDLCGLIEELPLDVERADQMFLMRLYDLAVVAEAVGDTVLARRLRPLIEPRVDAHANMTFATYGSMARAMGLVCAATGDADAGRGWLRQAADSNHRAGIRAWEARSLVDLARFDPEGRSAHLAGARSIGEAWGLPGVLDDIRRFESA